MKDSIIKIFVIVIIVLLLINLALLAVLGIVMLVTKDNPDTPSRPVEQQTDDTPVGTVPSDVVLEQTADMGQNYIDSIIFLGDSTTYHMINRAVLSGGKDTKQVWSGVDENGDPSGTLMLDGMIHKTNIYHPLDGKAKTVAQAVAEEKPKYMVITLGVNGIAYSTEAQFKAYYGKLIDAIEQASPDTKIILQSIFPVSASYDQKGGKLCNANIDVANTWIMQLAKDKGCKYLDTASVLKNSSGTMIESYNAGDGIHMTADAYRAILQYIRTHGYTD